ncbi:MAG: 2-oxo acid dehydrogenase subunit E2 [Deltaproteobacteria bacterium]|jgi:pyruvate dehydrogenase E2 component (dihydrolipoamide acetyltransferase)|nr:2-oxo acid dehydrogenase subunit E2 [Deltaproteobacteria bacterium]MBT6431676.1 2-oxo acid dehydrogenase subunit E2 [Deltaproteobacteria bacterium]MBT6490475.1 2-oxo acid dehydrogenase subunit E2 [Deltaproteobacteria bacterium]
MAQDVVMPQMGESIAEGTITTWLKNVGDTVERDEALFEMSTDKVDAEIPSPVEGTLLEIKVEAGATVEVGTVVAVIGAAGESVGTSAPAAAPAAAPAEAEPEAAAAAPASDAPKSAEERRRVKSSPVVRKIAAEHNIDIGQISGTGASGRVTKSDILSFIDSGAAAAPAAAAPVAAAPAAAAPAAAAPAAAAVAGQFEVPAAYRGKVMEGDRVEDMSNMRSKIAEHMVVSKHVSPHVATVWEVDFSRVAALRKKYKASWQERHGVNLTFTSFILKATVDALKAHPVLNASLDGKKMIYHRDINLGLAVALDWGLIVPVIKNAGELNLLGLTRRAGDLAERARSKKLNFDEVQNGTFTITNPGVFGPMFGLPVINQPQVGILGVGAVEKRPVVIDDMIAIRTRAYMAMSFDHRLVDGADADHFMKRIKTGIEEFDENEL